ncbi:19557_t:CDS:2, partial [Gigaspora rosea]
MSKQSKQPTKRSARLLQRTNKPELESIVHDKPQEHQSSLLPQPLVSIELIKRHPNIHLPGRLSRMPSESSNIMKSEDFDRIKEVDDLESENRSLNEEIGVLMQINELFDKESIVFQNQIKELEIKLKIANQEKGKSRANKLLELPVKAFNISNKNEETYFYVDEDEESDKETKAGYWAYITSEFEDEKVSETSSKRRRVTDYDSSIMYSRNSELETGESSTI